MKERFMKNGVFSLEYDKETLKDMVLELQEESQKQKEINQKAIEYINTHKRKDGFLELNEWQTRDLLQILEDKEVSE